MSALRIGLVGAGRAGLVHAGNIMNHVPNAVVSAIIDENLQAANQLAQSSDAPVFTSLDEPLADSIVDAVVITTPTFTHRDLAVQAMRAGKAVFCEKPMALTPTECQEMAEAAKQAGVVLQIGFMRRFQPEFVEAKRRLEEGSVGEPMIIKSLTRGPGLPPPWAWDLERSNGMLAEVNSHDFDCVRWLVGSNVERVYTEIANRKGTSRGVTAPNFYDNAVVTLRFQNDALGSIDGTCPADYGYDARVEVVGTEGLLIIGDVRGEALLEIRDREVGAVTPTHRTWPQRFNAGYQAEIQAFVAAVLDETPPMVTAEDGYQAVCAVVAANRSWQEERPVLLTEVAGG